MWLKRFRDLDREDQGRGGVVLGGGSGGSQAERSSISGYAYQPVTVTAGVGSRITFTNHDATAHTATSNKPAFDTGTLKPGHSGTVTLKQAGTYTYYCQFHAFMHGTVVVKVVR